MAIKLYAKIVNGKIVGLQNMEESLIGGFKGHWVEGQEEFGIGDLYDETNGYSVYIKTTEELEAEAIQWRDLELQATDFIVPLTDFPNHTAWITYRQTLRDWTTTEDFPNIKPTAPAEL